MYTGKDDINKVAEYVEWNGNFEIYANGGWGTPTAKMINGTGGYSFHPDMSRHENVTAFISELFRCVRVYGDWLYIMYIVHVLMRDERRKEVRSKQGLTNNMAKQHSTPKAVVFPKKIELPRVGLEPTTLYTLCTRV